MHELRSYPLQSLCHSLPCLKVDSEQCQFQHRLYANRGHVAMGLACLGA